jgi:hypothetical protein
MDCFFSCLAIGPGELDKLIKPASGLEERVGQVERESRAMALVSGVIAESVLILLR